MFRPSHEAVAVAVLSLLSGLAAQAQDATPALPVTEVRDSAPRAGQINLDATTSTGSRLGLTLRETPASIYLTDRNTMEQRGDRTTQEALRNVPGITATDKPDTGGFISYRGFNGSQITQLFNGITVQYDVVAARPLSSWIYDRVEVLGGPSSFLFGAGAVGGSINYITRLPERSNTADAQFGLGSYGSSQAAFGLNRQLSGDAGQQGHYLRLDVNTQRSRTAIEGNDGRSQQLAVSLLSDLTSRLTHTLALEYQHEDVRRPYWGTPLLRPATGEGQILGGTRFKNYNTADGQYEQTVNWARSILEYRATDSLRIKNTFYNYSALRDYRNVEEYTFNATNTGVTRFSPLLQRHVQHLTGDRLEATFNTALGGLQSDFAFGADYSINTQTRYPNGPVVNVSTVNPYNFTVENFFSIPGLTPGFVPDRDVRVKTLALFVENRTKILPGVSIVSGLRHDNIALDLTNRRAITVASPATLGRNYSPTTGRVGVVWDVTPNANVYAQYSTAADPPAGILTTASFAQVNGNLALTTGRQFEVGSKFGLLDGRATGTVAAYNIVRKNLATPDPAAPANTILVGQQSSRGVEMSLDAKLTPRLSAQFSLALVDPRFDSFSQVVSGKAVSLAGFTPPNTPKRVSSIFMSYNFAPGWMFDAGIRSVSRVLGDNANTLSAPGYSLLDLGLAYSFSKTVSVRTRIRNATDKVYASNVTATPMFYLGEARTADVTLRLSF